MKRPTVAVGQMAFAFPEIRSFSKPSVLLHKNGRYLLFKPQDPIAADILRDVLERMEVPGMRDAKFWGLGNEQLRVTDWKKIEIWKHLGGDIAGHPLCEVLRTYDVEIGTVPTLKNYIRKEWRRQQVELTAYPAPATTGTATLYERCSVGTNLRCTRSYRAPDDEKPVFEKDKHYLVVNNGGNGKDSIRIGVKALADGIVVEDGDSAFEWTPFHPAMEEHFDDSEDTDTGQTVDEAFPSETLRMRKKIEKLGFSLYEHVAIDAAMEAQKRGSLNCKLMRMAKTSEAITITHCWGSQKIAVFGSQNVRLAWEAEFQRLGVTDFVMVDTLADLDKPGRYYLMKYAWIRRMEDPTAIPRREHENYLRAAERVVRRKVEYSSKPDAITVFQHNPCPHCGEPMVRPALRVGDEWFGVREGLKRLYAKTATKVEWTTHRGYMCRNSKCSWKTSNRKKKGAAWSGKTVKHRPGSYIDWGLAAHVNCPDDAVHGRQCTCCRETDGVWIPQLTKRFKKRFTAIVPDEIHNIKDASTLTAQAVYRMRARRKLGLTGTLLANSALDAYWIMLWVLGGPSPHMPFERAQGRRLFDDRFCDHVVLEKPTGQIDDETGEEIKKAVRRRLPYLKNPADWWKFAAPKILRRNYSDPLFQKSLLDAGMYMPAWEIKKVMCPMTPAQIQLMLWALRDFRAVYEKAKEEAERKQQEINKAFVMSQMMAMRIAATVPDFMNVRMKEEIYKGLPGGGKLYPLTTIAKNRMLAGGKVLILSDFLHMQKVMEDELKGFGIIRFNTSWNDDQRREALMRFREDPDTRGMVAGTRAVSEALDFSFCDTALCCDLLWSPTFQSQAWSRILAPTPRQRECEIYLGLSPNTIDEYMYTVFYSKLIAAEQAMDRKVLNRRAIEVDIRWFADRVLEEEANLTMLLRDWETDDSTIVLPDMNEGLWEERVA